MEFRDTLMAWYVMFLGFMQGVYDAYTTLIMVVQKWLSRKSTLIHNNQISLLNYRDGSQDYTIIFPRVRGPAKFSHVISQDDVVTDNIKKVAGPSHNFHGIPTTPGMLGYHILIFHYRNGDTRLFGRNDIIDCNPHDNRQR